MSRTLKIPFPDIAAYTKTRLTTRPDDPSETVVVADTTLLYVRNTVGFSANDFVILEAFESDVAEIVQIASIDRTSRLLDLGNIQTIMDHAVGVVAMKTPYNKLRIFKGPSAELTTHTEITVTTSGTPPVVTSVPTDLRPDSAYTYYVDESGTSADFYSYQFWNSSSSIGGFQTLYTESAYDAILTVNDLKSHFMFGLDLTDDNGYPFPNSMFEFAIRAAVNSFQKTVQIILTPTGIFEYQDFFGQDYRDYAFVQLNHWPILSVEKIQIKYPTAQSPVDFPLEWVHLRRERGQIHLLPTSGSLSTILMGMGGDYLTFIWRGYDWMPNLWRIWYTAGMTNNGTYVDSLGHVQNSPALSQVPEDIIGIVGKMACFYPLNIAGDLVGGIAIASKSIGIDGLNQSINTTSSPENAGYSARLRQYERELKIEIPRLVQYYKAFRMASL